MQSLIDLYKNSESLHHAYFFATHKVKELVGELKDFIEEHLGLKTVGNPDVQHLEFKTLTIDEARAIAAAQERVAFGGGEASNMGRKIFIIETDFITEEAQNALLKVFEEPTAGTHFFIISPQDILLPTLRSRMQVINHLTLTPLAFQGEGRREGNERRGEVLSLGFKERLEKVKEITDAISDEEKTKQDAIAFLNQIESELYEKGVEESAQSLKICEHARAALYDRGAPVKMILEHLVLSV